jgi:ribosomal protein S18 acetylase RimI-like enzyme
MPFLLSTEIRPARPDEADAIAAVWHDAWQDAFTGVVPPSLAPHRTVAFFRNEIDRHVPHALVVISGGRVAGFSATSGDELSHFYLAPFARGRGVAGRLLRRTEEKLEASGVGEAFLLCAHGNERALRFYDRMGWHDTGRFVHAIAWVDGTVEVEAHRLVKPLGSPAERLRSSASR